MVKTTPLAATWFRLSVFAAIALAVGRAGGAAAQEPPPPPPPPPPVLPAPEPKVPEKFAQSGGAAEGAPQETAEPAPPAPGGNTIAGFLDFNVYPYLKGTRADSVVSINALAILPYGFSYFGFVNFNNAADRKPLMETNGFYTEQTLYWTPYKPLPLDALVQYNMISGDDNDRLRVGVKLRVDDVPLLGDLLRALHVSYAVNFHFYQLDHSDRYVWQIEQYGRMDFPWLDDRIYVSAFGDRTFNEKIPGLRSKNPLVSEIQGGLRLVEQLYFIYEFRILEYRADQVLNHAIGGEYVAKW